MPRQLAELLQLSVCADFDVHHDWRRLGSTGQDKQTCHPSESEVRLSVPAGL